MSDPIANPALKEWSSIWDALVAGRQLIDLRKGGIREETHRFRIRATRFWLYDSYEHERPELLRPDAAARVDAVRSERPARDRLRFSAWAELACAASITDPAQLAALDDEFIWTSGYAEQRLKWRPKQPLWLLVLRTYRLAEPIDVPVRDQYAGCTSWVPMQDLPADPRLVPAQPVLTDTEFARRVATIRTALPGVPFLEDPLHLIATA